VSDIELMSDNVIDATSLFLRKVQDTSENRDNLVFNKAFRSYCECIGQLTKDILEKTPYYDPTIDDEFFNFPSGDIVDVSMNESVTVTARNLADEIIKECEKSKIKVSIDSIVFRKFVVGNPERVSVTMRMGSRNA